jgi:hypothetical protein
MKNRFKLNSNLSFATVLLATGLFVASCDKDDDDKDDMNKTTYSISGNANGQQLNPVVDRPGSATFTGTLDSTRRELRFTTNWQNLTGRPSNASFYHGLSGTTGDSVGSAWSLDTTMTNSGSFTDTLNLSAEQMDQLLNGRWYYMFKTDSFTNGEIRGQLSAVRQ